MRNEDMTSRAEAFEEEHQKAAWDARIKILSEKLNRLEKEVGTIRSNMTYSDCVYAAEAAEARGDTEAATYLLALADKKRGAMQAKCSHAWSGNSLKWCSKCGISRPAKTIKG